LFHAAAGNVYVEPSVLVLNKAIEIPAGQLTSLPMELRQEVTLIMRIHVSGGTDDQANVWLMEQAEYEKFMRSQPSTYVKPMGGTVKGLKAFEGQVKKTGRYQLVLDNRAATFFARDVKVYAFGVLDSDTAYSVQTRSDFQALYDRIRSILVFPEFQISIRRCGFVNAFSDPDITLCTEFIEALATNKAAGDTLSFVFFHELGHSLLHLWDYPLADNEDVADEFASVAMIATGDERKAMNAAEWFARQTSLTEAFAQILVDDRHTMSPQRARNIMRWLEQGTPLLRRWQKLFVPNMQTAYLRSLQNNQAAWVDHELVRGELLKRTALGK
jgi:hypothetical protein